MIRLFAHVAAHVLRGEPLDPAVVRAGVANAREVLGPGEALLSRAAEVGRVLQAELLKAAASPTPDTPPTSSEDGPRTKCSVTACNNLATHGVDSAPEYCRACVEKFGLHGCLCIRGAPHWPVEPWAPGDEPVAP